jgi:hypothetical protein
MPALFPTFQLLMYGAAESTLVVAPKLAETYAIPSGEYGFYEPQGFVFNPPYIYPTDTWGGTPYEWEPTATTHLTYGPRSLLLCRDLGFVEELIIYAKLDYVGRTFNEFGPEEADLGTTFGASSSFNDDDPELVFAVFDPQVATARLYVPVERGEPSLNPVHARDFGLPYFPPTEVFSPETGPLPGGAWAAEATAPFVVPITTPFKSLGAAFWFGFDAPSRFYRQTIVGIRVNGVLYGRNEKGLFEEPTPQEDGTYTGDIWWRDLQNCEQSGIPGSTGVFRLPYSNPAGSFIDGYNEGYNNSGAYWSGGSQYESSPTDAKLRSYRDAFRQGVAQGVFDVVDEGGVPYNVADAITEVAFEYPFRFALIDAQRDLVVAGTVTNGQYFTVAANALGYTAPEQFSDDTAYGPEMVDRYNGYYQGYLDGMADSIPNNLFDVASGQTGSADYNDAYFDGYSQGYNDGPGDNFGDDDPP